MTERHRTPRTDDRLVRPARRAGRRLAVAVAATMLVAAACGGGDDAEADPAAGATAATATTADDTSATDPPVTDAPATSTGSTAVPAAVEGPVSTISPEIPEEFLPAIGPVDLGGAPLPPLESDDVTADPAVGAPAPTLVGLDYDGNPVRVDAAQDGPTLVVFLAHWCPHCNAEIPVLNELRDAGRFPDGLNIVAVSTAANAGRPNFPPGQWLEDKDWTYPAMADGVDVEAQSFIAADAYGVNAFPFVTLIDGDGDVAARWAGERTADEWVDLIGTHLGL